MYEQEKSFVPVLFIIVKIGVSILEKTLLTPISLEQLKLFGRNNVCSNNYKKLENLGMVTQDLREIIKKIIKKNV